MWTCSFPLQANVPVIEAVNNALALVGRVVVPDAIKLSGDTSAASIPIALTRLVETGRARAGQLALLGRFGAGLSYAAQVVCLPVRRLYTSTSREA
jgi:3-oxoacyl-[acyl-carrier-protein] synthase-3